MEGVRGLGEGAKSAFNNPHTVFTVSAVTASK